MPTLKNVTCKYWSRPNSIFFKEKNEHCKSQPIKKRGLYYFAKDGSIITFIGHGRFSGEI